MSEINFSINISGIRYGTDILPYSNATFGIVSGSWSILNHDPMLSSVSKSMAQINISKGGNLASGYSFNFKIANIDFAKKVFEDAVFFDSCPIYVSVEIDGVEKPQWHGIIDSISVESDVNVTFKCVDKLLKDSSMIGSSLVPVTLNTNYNCKLVKSRFEGGAKPIYTNKEGRVFDYVVLGASGVSPIDGSDSYISVNCDKGVFDGVDSDQYSNYIINVAANGGSGKKFEVINIRIEPISLDHPKSRYVFYVLGDTSDLIPFSSMIQVIQSNSYYYFSEDPPLKIFRRQRDQEKPLLLYTNDDDYIPCENYFIFSQAGKPPEIRLNNMIDEDSILLNDGYELTYNQTAGDLSYQGTFKNTSFPFSEFGIWQARFAANVSQNDFNEIITTNRIGVPQSFNIGKIKVINTNLGDGINNEIAGGLRSFSVTLYGLTELYGDTISKFRIPIAEYSGEFSGSYDRVENDFIFSIGDFSTAFTDAMRIDGNLKSYDIINRCQIEVKIGFLVQGTSSSQIYNSGVIAEDVKIKFRGEYKIDRLQIGCVGQNMFFYGAYPTYGTSNPMQTLEYLQTRYMSTLIGEIDTASYDQALFEYQYFPNNFFIKNPAHQITEQLKTINVVKDILFFYNIAMFTSKDGKYKIRNWMWESIVYDNNVTPKAIFNNTNMIAVSDIEIDAFNPIYTDIEVLWDYNESSDEYQASTRIKGAGNSVFDFSRDTEGVPLQASAIAESIHDQLKAAYNRLGKNNPLRLECKWIKSPFTYDTTNGSGEVLAFMSAMSTHINRLHRYCTITIPFSASNLDIDLMDLIVFRDKILTHNMEFRGWVTKREVDYITMKIYLKLFLDISANDPFIVYVDVIQDTPDLTQPILIDDPNATDIIQDGTGKRI